MYDNLFLGLVHNPVYNKNKEIVTTSLTNLDIHDIARTCKTYGIKNYFLINPEQSQKDIFNRLKDFWRTGPGKQYNINRFDAFKLIEFVPDIEAAKQWIKDRYSQDPILITTSARLVPGSVSYKEMRKIINRSFPKLILFGTGYGMSEELVNSSNFHIFRIEGAGPYNHLSVRSAIAITLDRLIGDYE